MKLNFFHVGTGPALIILHGLFGSASNFRTLAKKFSEEYAVYCLDLRNHGASPHNDDISFDAMAADVIEFMDEHELKNAYIMGHSLGGKVAMQIALNYPNRVSKLIIGDIAPVSYPHHHDRIFEGLNAVGNQSVSSRKEAENILAEFVDIPAVRLFLLTNLERKEDRSLQWKINVSGLQNNYHDISKKPNGSPYPGPSIFIRGELSDYIQKKHIPVINDLFPHGEIVTLKGAGHWLHAEKPVEYIEMVFEFLNRK